MDTLDNLVNMPTEAELGEWFKGYNAGYVQGEKNTDQSETYLHEKKDDKTNLETLIGDETFSDPESFIPGYETGWSAAWKYAQKKTEENQSGNQPGNQNENSDSPGDAQNNTPSGSDGLQPSESNPYMCTGCEEDLKDKLGNMMGVGECQPLQDYTDGEINNALNDLIKSHGKARYDQIKKFIKKVRPDFKDSHDKKSSSKLPGLESTNITWFDEEIAYYDRLASTYGLYIVKKPLEVVKEDTYPGPQIEFEVDGNPLRINVHSGPWILPEITTMYEDRPGEHPSTEFEIPHLIAHIDSSGSMRHPHNRSYAILAAHILGRNYRGNGKLVGINNFSTHMLFQPPTDDYDRYQRVATAYWGGGTALDIPRFQEWMERLKVQGDKRIDNIDILTTEEETYEALKQTMRPDEIAEVEEKNVNIDFSREAKNSQFYKRIDHVMFTDGEIYNIQEVVNYLNSMAEFTRNTIFLIDNHEDFERWSALDLENTVIYDVNKEEDLVGLSIGMAKSVFQQK